MIENGIGGKLCGRCAVNQNLVLLEGGAEEIKSEMEGG